MVQDGSLSGSASREPQRVSNKKPKAAHDDQDKRKHKDDCH
jgi:hypothetical protein